ncbi:hypothetical protein [Micromonospora sp. NBC_00617]
MRRGDIASALSTHDQLCQILAGDLGVKPGQRISRLIGIIRAASQR